MREQLIYRTREKNRSSRAAEAQPMVLRVVGSDQAIAIDRPQCTVGTARDNTLILVDPYVSRRHCTVLRRDDALWLQDEGSRNGTWVNSVRVERCSVAPGARIVVGLTTLHLGDEAARTLGLIGRHPTMQKVREQYERLGASLRPVLVLGETGTGKELVARALHEHSPCRLGPFEPLNCGAIPRDLAEAELFGHAAGAFTGASRERKGAFERASGGTLFLDEIGEMPLALQPKILRILEDGAVQRLGEEQRRSVTVRIIAATHRDLQREAERGRFRLDLYHRLAVGVIELPPLRDRAVDVPLLAQHFLAGEGVPGLELEAGALAVLQHHTWPGNVRQLRNAIQRAAALADSGRPLRTEDFGFLSQSPEGEPRDREGYVRCVGRPFDAIRREIFVANVRACGGNRSAAATVLGIPKSTFFDQLRDMGI